MAIWRRKTDRAIILELGERVKQYRINAKYTQAQLAEKAGVDRRTLQKLEYGENPNMLTFIQILRALGELDQLAPLLEQVEQISPLKLLEEEKSKYKRKRVRPKKNDL
jgi:transcriptional regulator with XRE-family HTH domain